MGCVVSFLRVSDKATGFRIGEFGDVLGLMHGLVGYFRLHPVVNMEAKVPDAIESLCINLMDGTPIYQDCAMLGIRVIKVLR